MKMSMATNERAAWVFFSAVILIGLWAFCEESGERDQALSALRDSIQAAQPDTLKGCEELRHHLTPTGGEWWITLCEDEPNG